MSALTEAFAAGTVAPAQHLRTLTVAPSGSVAPGETIRASFCFSNLGGACATGMRVRFELPAGTAHVAGSDTVDEAAYAGDSSFVSTDGAALADLEPGGERTVSCAFRVNDPIENGTVLSFQAALIADGAPLARSNVERRTARSVPVLEGAQTVVTIVAAAVPKPGDAFTIRVTVANAGQSSARDVTLALPLPEGTTYVPRSARIAGRALSGFEFEPFDYASGAIVAPRLNAGQSVTAEYQATIDAPRPDGNHMRAHGTVSSREVAEFTIASQEVTVSSPARFESDRTKLIVECDDAIAPGTVVPVALHVHNGGSGPAANVSVQFMLPAGLLFAPGSARIDGQPVSDESFPGRTFSLGTLASKRSVEVRFLTIAAVPAADEDRLFAVSAVLSWKGGERRFERRLSVTAAPRFSQARNGIEAVRSIVHAREDAVFLVRVFNDGTAAQRDVALRIIPGAFLEDVRVAETPGETFPYREPLALGLVQPQVARAFSVTARVTCPVPDRTQLALGAVLAFDAGDFDLGVANAIVRSRPRVHPERCSWESDAGGALRPNQTCSVTISFTNDGSDTLRDAQLELLLPSELVLENADNARREGSTLHFDDVPAQSTHQARATLRLLRAHGKGNALTLGGVLSGKRISAIALPPLELPAFAQADFSAGAELRSTPSGTIDANERVSYEARLHNSGDGTCERLTLRAALSKSLVYVPGSTTVNGANIADERGASMLWSKNGLILTDVDPDSDIVVRWEAIVASPLPADAPIETRADAQWDTDCSLTVDAPLLRVLGAPSLEAGAAGTPISIAGIAARQPVGRPPSAVPASEPRETPSPAAAPSIPATHVPPQDDEGAHTPILFAEFSPERLAQVVETLARARACGLLQHLFALRSFFPAGVIGATTDLEEVARTADRALRPPLDKLFVRMHVPGVTVGAKDLEDRDGRAALRAYVDELVRWEPAQTAPGPHAAGTVRFEGSPDRDVLATLARELETAPLGSATPWIVSAQMLGQTIEPGANAPSALLAYRSQLLHALSLLETLPVAEFHRVLATSVNHSLDASLDALLEEMRHIARLVAK